MKLSEKIKQAIKEDRTKRARKAAKSRWDKLSPEDRRKQLANATEAAMLARGYVKIDGHWNLIG